MKEFFKENWRLVFILLYVLSPLDIFPDDIPLIGQIDDAGVVLAELIRRYFEFNKLNRPK